MASPCDDVSRALNDNAGAELWQGFRDRRVSRKLRQMCGRYSSYLPPELMAHLFGAKNPLPNLGCAGGRRYPETAERPLEPLVMRSVGEGKR